MEPYIKKSSFWADGINGFLLRPVYREPAPKPKVEAHQSHPDIPNGSKVLINSPMRPSLVGLVGIVHGYWPLASSGPHFTVWLPDAEYPDTPYGFNRGELTLIQEEGTI